MLQTKNGYNRPSSFQEVKKYKVVNGRQTTHNDGRRPIVIGHLSDSHDQNTKHLFPTTHII